MIALLMASALAQTYVADLEATSEPAEVPNLAPHAVTDWVYGGDGTPPFVQAQVGKMGIEYYCVDLVTEDSPSNQASSGKLRHFAHVEGLDSPATGVSNEWIETTVQGLVPGAPYRITFEASILRHVGQTPGFFRVSLGDDVLDAPTLTLPASNPGQQAWIEQALDPFVPDDTSETLRFEAVSLADLAPGTITPFNDCGYLTVQGLAQLLLDGIRIWPDTDGDGLFDDEDVCPTVAEVLPGDQDGDGLADELDTEEVYGTDPCNPDSDYDTLPDGLEVQIAADYGTTAPKVLCPDPNDADSDDDDVDDGIEVNGWDIVIECGNGTTTPSGTTVHVTSDPCVTDTDEDKVDDGVEHAQGSNPNHMDTDGDKLYDDEDPAPAVCDEDVDTADTGGGGTPGDPREPVETECKDDDCYAGCTCSSSGASGAWLVLVGLLGLLRRRYGDATSPLPRR